MTNLRSIAEKLSIITTFAFLLLFSNNSFSQDGKALFMQNCASCHAMDKQLTGPALAGAAERWNNDKMLHAWIKNNQKVIASGYPHAVEIYNQFNKTPMNVFEGALSDQDIDAIIKYIKDYKPPALPAAGGGGTPGAVATTSNNNALLYGILTLILAIVAFVLLQVNANLKKMADDKEGIPAHEPVPFWRNKVYLMFAALVLFLLGGYYLTMGAIDLGRSQNYEPQQPIFYSHKVHAGINQISCLYCHGNTQDGKQANIPSVNICMNCHMAINEYKGEPVYDANGNEVNGTNEIQKLYKYAGFETGKPWDPSKAKPVEWVRIHNLPDHVYFNHSQHVVVGKVQCQTCHGEIQKMDEVHQFADLSMGWCINCHRETQVKFNDNGFYSIYEKYHDDLKKGIIDTTKLTEEKMGGTDCQRCHY